MRIAWTVPAWMYGLGIILLAPAESHAAVAYRMTGAACQLRNHDQGAFRYAPAIAVYGNEPWPDEGWASLACPIPTSDSTFTPSTLSHVNVRYHEDLDIAAVFGYLYFHDYDSYSYVECGDDVDLLEFSLGPGFYTLQIEKSCLPTEYESNWGVEVVIEATGMYDNESINVRLLTAYK